MRLLYLVVVAYYNIMGLLRNIWWGGLELWICTYIPWYDYEK